MSRRKKKIENVCTHSDGWTFTRTEKGVKRTCKNKKCNFSVTEVAAGIGSHTITPIKQYKSKKRKANEETPPVDPLLPV